MPKLKSLLALDPNTSLEKQTLFWLSVGVPILIAILLGIPVWSNYTLGFNAAAYENFLIVSALPIGISSLAIPLGVLVGRLHSTKQVAEQLAKTQHQINASEQDNRTKFFLAHYEHFMDHFSDIFDVKHEIPGTSIEIRLNRKKYYKAIYPNNGLTEGVRPSSSNQLECACMEFSKTYKCILSLSSDFRNSKVGHGVLEKVAGSIDSLYLTLSLLGISLVSGEGQQKLDSFMVKHHVRYALVSIRFVHMVIVNSIEFDINLATKGLRNALSELSNVQCDIFKEIEFSETLILALDRMLEESTIE